jgi:hypothetical protein
MNYWSSDCKLLDRQRELERDYYELTRGDLIELGEIQSELRMRKEQREEEELIKELQEKQRQRDEEWSRHQEAGELEAYNYAMYEAYCQEQLIDMIKQNWPDAHFQMMFQGEVLGLA